MFGFVANVRPSFDHTASPQKTRSSSGVCVTCPRTNKGADSRTDPCKPASHQESGTGSATSNSSLNISDFQGPYLAGIAECRMAMCTQTKRPKDLQSRLLYCNIANSCIYQGSWHSWGPFVCGATILDRWADAHMRVLAPFVDCFTDLPPRIPEAYVECMVITSHATLFTRQP